MSMVLFEMSEHGVAWTDCIGISSGLKGFDVEVHRASESICEFVMLNHLDEFHASIIRS